MPEQERVSDEELQAMKRAYSNDRANFPDLFAVIETLQELRFMVNAKYWEGIRDDNTKLRKRIAELEGGDQRMLRLKAEEMAYQQYGHEMARMGDEAAKLRARIAELEAERERILGVLGEHPESETDIAVRVQEIRDEGRSHFHDYTNAWNKLKELEAENARMREACSKAVEAWGVRDVFLLPEEKAALEAIRLALQPRGEKELKGEHMRFGRMNAGRVLNTMQNPPDTTGKPFCKCEHRIDPKMIAEALGASRSICTKCGCPIDTGKSSDAQRGEKEKP